VKARTVAAAALIVGLALSTSACTFGAPQATLIHYDPSDGISANVGAIEFRNLLAISPDGTDANLVGVMINTSKSAQTVEFQYTRHADGVTEPVNDPVLIPAGAIVSFGNPGVQQLVFRDADVMPGSLLTLFIQYDDQTGKKVRIPVLDGSEGPYTTLTPSPTPTPIPTITSTAKPVTK
jgi:hypothetical protein